MIIFIRMIFCILILSYISGCSKIITTEVQQDILSGKLTCDGSNYTIGAVQKAQPGNPIVYCKLTEGILWEKLESVLPSDNFIIKYLNSDMSPKEIFIGTSGSKLGIIGQTFIDNKEYYVVPMLSNNNDNRGVLIDKDGFISNLGVLNSYYDKLVPSTAVDVQPSNLKFTFAKTSYERLASSPRIIYELIFSGENNTGINLLYREYTPENIARPAYTQTIIYDTKASEIKFKNILVKINDISKGTLTYTVLEDGTGRINK